MSGILTNDAITKLMEGNEMDDRMENVISTLKGVASILVTMSEAPKGDVEWNEWALHLLGEEVSECVRLLEEIAEEEEE